MATRAPGTSSHATWMMRRANEVRAPSLVANLEPVVRVSAFSRRDPGGPAACECVCV